MSVNIQNISELLDAVTSLTGLPVLWKNAQGGAEKELPLCQKLHTGPFCVKVKHHKKRLQRCSLNDSQLHREAACRHKKPFMYECHAGVTELVVPLFDNDVFVGTIILGPMRQPGGTCIYSELQGEYQRLPEYDEQVVNAAGKILNMAECFIIERMRGLLLRNSNNRKVDFRIERATEYINLHYAESVSAGKLAKLCGLSYSRFIHLFKEQLGAGFSDYVAWRRIEEAKLLLKESALEIFDIAANCGFASQSYFGSVFKKSTGVQPGKYRKKHCCKLAP